jgi:hypothetical protein
LKIEYLLHPIDRELGITADEALEHERAEQENDMRVAQGVKIATNRGE